MKLLLWCFAIYLLFGQSDQWVQEFKYPTSRRDIPKYLELKCNKEKICYMRGRLNNGDAICQPEGYIPGGGITNVKQITAPNAELQKEFLGIVAGKAAGKLGNSGKIIGVMSKFSSFFDKASKMAPWIGALSGVFGFFVKKPSAQDAVDASNKAIKELTSAVNARLDEMTLYVGAKIVKSEKDWTVRKYDELYNKWADCMVNHITVETVNECQRRAFGTIRAARPHFLVYQGKKSLTRYKIKRLEVTFLSIRDYAMLNLMVLRSLVDSSKAEEGTMAQAYYKHYLKLTVAIAQQLVEYATSGNNHIMNFYDTQIKSSCTSTFACGRIIEVDDTKWWESARIMSIHRDCYCKMRPDVLNSQWCRGNAEVRMDYVLDHSQYKKYDYSGRENKGWINVHTAIIQYTKDVLFSLSTSYWKTTSDLVRTYWDKNIMSIVPLWKEIGDNAKYELASIGCEWKTGDGMSGTNANAERRYYGKTSDKQACLIKCIEMKTTKNHNINGASFANHACLCEINMDGRNGDIRYKSCIFAESGTKREVEMEVDLEDNFNLLLNQ